jgi:hypothetical protein
VKWTEFVEIVNAAQKPSKKTPIRKNPAKKTSIETVAPAAGSDTE